MTSSTSHHQIGDLVAKYGLSKMAANNALEDLPWDRLEKMLANSWRPDNPDGLVFLGVADNPLLQQEVATYITNNTVITSSDHLSYGVGPRGSPRLKKALATFFSTDFGAHEPVAESGILILPGVVAVIDALAWSICNENEGIIVPVPSYTGFKPAVGERSRAVLIPACFQPIEGYTTLDDVFDPEMNKHALEDALLKATSDGVTVRAVMLSNPHNPLGRCYPAETLREIASFCGRYHLHLICDEIFAKSVYKNGRASNVVPFTSILSLDLGDLIERQFIHVAYGMGKDFCASGLRIGALVSRNEGLIAAVSSICVFGWVPYAAQDMWANMLEDKEYLTTFMTKKSRILAEHCEILTAFLERNKIPYYTNVNAGTYVWVDLRHCLVSESSRGGELDLSTTKLSGPRTEEYRNSEMKLFKRGLEYGVGISVGSSFLSEELGWFRISFAVEKQALCLGLERLLRSLQAKQPVC